MAICAGGLSRYLDELDALPDRPLIAFIPVNVRPKDSDGGGNDVGATLVSLATDVDDRSPDWPPSPRPRAPPSPG